MKTFTLTLFLTVFGTVYLSAQQSDVDKEIIALSKEKWKWMSDKNVEKLNELFDREINVCAYGGIMGQAARARCNQKWKYLV
ncbi:Uncharacterised protein [Sphingobacterium spiritivorum]|uniref:DUF4440 domain-containing protein n=1 Tax=Sphingobacterium spiritivorum TaxID=258 RepID=A0A380CEZ8_SPHSI|nr:hypothetical protein [Sphingobacterium spiritivorum]SUJ19296.1 Uncharacterised protein [Sphingobacterium spiritivorum]